MFTASKNHRTAILIVAVLLSALLVGACATKRDVEEIKDQLTRIESQNRESSRIVERVDSLIAQSAAANNALRSDVRVSVNDLQQQMATLLENYNQLVQQLNALTRALETRGILKGSVGEQVYEQPAEMTTPTPPPPSPSMVNCDSIYDDAFILARQEEYERAIDGFRNFLAECGTHANVPDAYFWIGESYYRMERFDRAIPEFEHLVATYKESPKLVSALYKIGRSQQELGRADAARSTFQQIVDEYPGSAEAQQARDRLTEL
ncbi:tol-pal system protein YbgF [candidate division GN15 bacterium]|nr:tol-pal system protein YbgF [candidate division GN15 bacterium]